MRVPPTVSSVHSFGGVLSNAGPRVIMVDADSFPPLYIYIFGGGFT